MEIHSAYLGMLGESGRTRPMHEQELSKPKIMRQNDEMELNGIVQLYLNALGFVANAIQTRDIGILDVGVGDNNCQVLTALVFDAIQQVGEEIKGLIPLLETKKGGVMGIEGKLPHEVIKEGKHLPQVSEMLQYLVHISILRAGTVCVLRSDGSESLRVDPKKIIASLKTSLTGRLMELLIRPIRESLNQKGIAYIQEVARRSLTPLESSYVEEVHVAESLCCHTSFQYVCSFYNIKAAIFSMRDKGIPFVVVDYNRSDGPAYFFVGPLMQRVREEDLLPGSPVCVIEGFFQKDFGEMCQAVGLFEFILQNAANCSQIGDIRYGSDNEDLEGVPKEARAEILSYREKGGALSKNYAIRSVRPDTVENFRKNQVRGHSKER